MTSPVWKTAAKWFSWVVKFGLHRDIPGRHTQTVHQIGTPKRHTITVHPNGTPKRHMKTTHQKGKPKGYTKTAHHNVTSKRHTKTAHQNGAPKRPIETVHPKKGRAIPVRSSVDRVLTKRYTYQNGTPQWYTQRRSHTYSSIS